VRRRARTSRPEALDLRFALPLHAEFYEDRNGSLEVVDDNADVVHPLDRHGGPPSSWALVYLGRSQHRILDSRT
jgi:hypothetical protein